MNTLRLIRLLLPAAVICAAATATAAPLKVFILAGQSNMQGHARTSTFDYIGKDPKTAPLLKEMIQSDGTPVTCDHTWISFVSEDRNQKPTTKQGKLTSGFGAGDDKIGPEFTFGITMEKSIKAPILIIKTAWGGKSLHTDFLPPSSSDGKPGKYYGLMMDHVKKVLADPKTVYPDYHENDGFELAGFVWFQGWNDMTDSGVYPNRHLEGGYDQYTKWMGELIRDVRKDLNTPDLPFVIGVLGVGGKLDFENPNRYTPIHHNFRMAMAAPAKQKEFIGSVAAVFTEECWDNLQDQALAKRSQVNGEIKKIEKEGKKFSSEERQNLYDEKLAKLLTKEEREALDGVSNQGFHYHGSAKILGCIGKRFAEAMLTLMK